MFYELFNNNKVLKEVTVVRRNPSCPSLKDETVRPLEGGIFRVEFNYGLQPS